MSTRVVKKITQRLLKQGIIALALAGRSVFGATYESKHYRINSDLDPAAVKDYAKRLDALYDEYSRRLADFESSIDKKFEVQLFRKRNDYLKFTGNRVPNTMGIFIPALNTLAGYEENLGRSGLMQTLQHEAFHQFAWGVISQNLPIWLDEGLAQVFEEGVWTGDKFILGQLPLNRIQDLQTDIKEGRFVRFREFLSMSRDEFQSRMTDPIKARAQYNQAWAMTQFLVFAEVDGKPKFRGRLLQWLSDMHGGQDSMSSFADNFSPNIEGFEKRFLEWASTLKPTPMSIYSYRMSKLGELVRILKDGGKEFSNTDELRSYLSKGRFKLTERREGQTYVREENALTYLNDLTDQPWSSAQLRFEKKGGQLPDIVLQPPNLTSIRVRYVKSGGELSAELVFGE